MRTILSFIAFACILMNASAQKIYSVDSRYDADIKVYVVDSRYDADLLVYKCDSRYDAEGNKILDMYALESVPEEIENYIQAAAAEPAMEESAIFDAVVDIVVGGQFPRTGTGDFQRNGHGYAFRRRHAVFLLLQRYFVRGLMAGSVKG